MTVEKAEDPLLSERILTQVFCLQLWQLPARDQPLDQLLCGSSFRSDLEAAEGVRSTKQYRRSARQYCLTCARDALRTHREGGTESSDGVTDVVLDVEAVTGVRQGGQRHDEV